MKAEDAIVVDRFSGSWGGRDVFFLRAVWVTQLTDDATGHQHAILTGFAYRQLAASRLTRFHEGVVAELGQTPSPPPGEAEEDLATEVSNVLTWPRVRWLFHEQAREGCAFECRVDVMEDVVRVGAPHDLRVGEDLMAVWPDVFAVFSTAVTYMGQPWAECKLCSTARQKNFTRVIRPWR